MLSQLPDPQALQSVLNELHDIQEPSPVGAWPPAPGWWILAAVLALLLLWLGLRSRHRVALLAWQWHWLRQLPSPVTEPSYFARLNRVLKNAAQKRWPCQHPLTLSGDAWVRFLQAKAPSLDSQKIAGLVNSGLRPEPEMDAGQADRLARQWIRRQAP